MNIYYLCRTGEDIREEISNCTGGTSHRVTVRGGADYYGARLRALQHAQGVGARRVLVVLGRAQVLRAASARLDAPLDLRACGPTDHHGLLLYLGRLLDAHAGAVLLPPRHALPQVRKAGGDFMPVLPSVSAYQVAPALALAADKPTLEHDLCAQGYRVITLTDYAVDLEGDPGLDTFGTPTTWRKVHARATNPFL